MITEEYYFRDLIHTEENNPSNNIVTRGFSSILDSIDSVKYIVLGVLLVAFLLRR